MLKGKTVILGITGSIAAYKTAYLASMLKKSHCDVHVIMTKNAGHFITPLTFETLTGNKCLTDTFDRDFEFDVTHISLAKKADLIMIAPASADVIAKLSWGLADDMLTTVTLAATCKKIIAPAMNSAMLENPLTRENLDRLSAHDFKIISPASGLLACNDVGPGKMPEPEVLFQYIIKELAMEKDLSGKHVLVTAGPTKESIDPVRYITNRSTGKMGYAIAEAAVLRGARVTLISGETSQMPPMFTRFVQVSSAAQMLDAVMANSKDADLIFKAAAVADYTPATTSDNKIKKNGSDMTISLVPTKDILKELGMAKAPGQIICGFSMETENMLENSRAKLEKKNADMIIANNLRVEGAGFGTDTNVITLITKDEIMPLPKMSKFQAACKIIDKALSL